MPDNINTMGNAGTEDMRIFRSDEFGQVRTLLIDGEPYFAGKDIAEILGYTNPQN